MQKPCPNDWIEDWPHDNGMYQNTCVTCTTHFIGNKYRRVCKVCHEESRVVVCAATQLIFSDNTSLIVASPRHWDKTAHSIVDRLKDTPTIDDETQGFIDQYGVFMTRQEAHVIATRKNQIVRRCGGDDHKLFSENLY